MQGGASSVVKKHPEGLRRVSLTAGFHRDSLTAPSPGEGQALFVTEALCQKFCSASCKN